MAYSAHCKYLRDANDVCVEYELYLKGSSGVKHTVGRATKEFGTPFGRSQYYFEFHPIKKLRSVISGGEFDRMRDIKEMLRRHSDPIMNRLH